MFLTTVLLLHICFFSLLWGTPSRPLFYIYDWPVINETRYGYTSLSNLADVYPPEGIELDPKSAYDHSFRGHGGAGMMLDESIGLHTTWQFSLFQMVYSRLLVSEHRTLDPKKATAFIVPFDPGVHSYVDHMTGESNGRNGLQTHDDPLILQYTKVR